MHGHVYVRKQKIKFCVSRGNVEKEQAGEKIHEVSE